MLITTLLVASVLGQGVVLRGTGNDTIQSVQGRMLVQTQCGTRENPCFVRSEILPSTQVPPASVVMVPFDDLATCRQEWRAAKEYKGAVWTVLSMTGVLISLSVLLARLDKIALAWRRSELNTQPLFRALLYLLASAAGSAIVLGLSAL